MPSWGVVPDRRISREFQLSEHLQDGFLREIDEELRHERYAVLWKKYGNYIIAITLVLIFSVGGYQAWHGYDMSNRQADGESYSKAMRLVSEKRPKEAAKAFSELAEKAGGGYAMLAKFQKAAALAKAGEKDLATAVYGQLADDSSIDPVYRDLARMFGVILEMRSSKDPAALLRRLASLNAEDNPWRHSVREVSALLAEQDGKHDQAVELLNSVKNDATTPPPMRRRAEELLNALGPQ